MEKAEGTLIDTWARVDGKCMFARVSRVAAPADSLPVVLVHGLGVCGRYMEPLARLLAPRHRVYVPDLPGFGRSEKPKRALTIAELSETLARWMRAMGLERAALLGNSLGCQIIADLAVRHPEMAAAVNLTSPTVDPAARTTWRILGRFLLDVPQEPPALAVIVARDYLLAGPSRLLRTFGFMMGDALEEKLPRMAMPALVVRGRRDAVVSHAWTQRVADLLPDGHFVELAGGCHGICYDAARELADAVMTFLAGISAPELATWVEAHKEGA